MSWGVSTKADIFIYVVPSKYTSFLELSIAPSWLTYPFSPKISQEVISSPCSILSNRLACNGVNVPKPKVIYLNALVVIHICASALSIFLPVNADSPLGSSIATKLISSELWLTPNAGALIALYALTYAAFWAFALLTASTMFFKVTAWSPSNISFIAWVLIQSLKNICFKL